MKSIIKAANAHGLGIYNYKPETSFRLIHSATRKEMSFVKNNGVWIASADCGTVVLPFLSFKALTIALMAMHGSVNGFFKVNRHGVMSLLTEAEYHALTN